MNLFSLWQLLPLSKTKCVCFCLSWLTLVTCKQKKVKLDPDPVDMRSQFMQETEVVVGLRDAPTVYYLDKKGKSRGFEYELAFEFARFLGKKPRFEIVDTTEELMYLLQTGSIHFAAAGLAMTRERKLSIDFGPIYQTVRQYIVCRSGIGQKKAKDLIGLTILIPAKTSYRDLLVDLRMELPGLEWKETSLLSSEKILEEVHQGRVDCTICDESIYEMNRDLFDRINLAGTIGQPSKLGWGIPKKFSFLKPIMDQWFQLQEKSGFLRTLSQKYFGYLNASDRYGIKILKKRMRTRLPKYLSELKKASDLYQFPLSLLAAMSYQESYWNHLAKSPTGVRGFMMLTLPTAEYIGVDNRLDPKQSIFGGAKYLANLRKRLPPFLKHDDATWMSLAAYNVGYNHLQDSRKLAIDLNKDPNSWLAIEKVLPFLSRKEYYSKLKYGYARGHEPVSYVRRIRLYQRVIQNEWETYGTSPVMGLSH